jgi:hypothetical protein
MQRNTVHTLTAQSESDSVAAQLRDLERQGGGMANLAHLCAGLLLAAFSLGLAHLHLAGGVLPLPSALHDVS